MEKLLLILLVLISMISLTGCWDRIEVNDMAFVAAAEFDKEAENKFRISVLVPLPSALGGVGSSGGGGGTSGSKPYYIDSDVGRNIMEAINKLQHHMSRKIYFAHRRVLIIGEKLARRGFWKIIGLDFKESPIAINYLCPYCQWGC